MSAKILVAEDEPYDRLFLERAFKNAGLEKDVEYVSEGAQAVEYLSKADGDGIPKVLLVDLKMPRMDGFQVMEWVGQQRRLDSMRVVVLTSSDAPDDKTHAVGLGADEYYIKPKNANDLMRLALGLKLYLETEAALAKMR